MKRHLFIVLVGNLLIGIMWANLVRESIGTNIFEDYKKFIYISPDFQIGCNFDKIHIRECY